MGLRDYSNLPGSAQTGSQSGPILYVGNNGGVVEPTTVTFFRLTDDIDRDGVYAAAFVLDPTTGLATMITDFDDFHEFNIAYDRITLGGIPRSGAIDVVNVIWLSDDEGTAEDNANTIAAWNAAEALRIRDWQATGFDGGAVAPTDWNLPDVGPAPRFTPVTYGPRKNGVGIIYGMRMIERQDGTTFSGDGGILGRTQFETVAENHIMGPQVGMVWVKSRGRWSARLQGIVSMGFNYGDVKQNGRVGAELAVPGAINRPLYAQPTDISHGDSHDEFSPSGELRAEADYRITDNVTFAVNWSGVAIENALLSENRIRYFLPDMGLVDPGNQELLVHNFFCGVEMVR